MTLTRSRAVHTGSFTSQFNVPAYSETVLLRPL